MNEQYIAPNEYTLWKNIAGENRTEEFRLKNISETKNYFNKEMIQNDLRSRKQKTVVGF